MFDAATSRVDTCPEFLHILGLDPVDSLDFSTYTVLVAHQPFREPAWHDVQLAHPVSEDVVLYCGHDRR